jgi:branched-chain amino acid transport system substrate-binding protein
LENAVLFNSKGLAKIQSIFLISVIVVAVGAGVIYLWLNDLDQSDDTIRIGVCADLDNILGKMVWQEVVLAVEQVNSNGGVLGKKFEVVAVDDDSESQLPDSVVATKELTRLINVEGADFIINSGLGGFSSVYQEIIAEHKKILFDGYVTDDGLTQKVLDNYDRYKFYFRAGINNRTSATKGVTDMCSVFREHTGFDKIALIQHDTPGTVEKQTIYVNSLTENGFDVVYTTRIPLDTFDFTSFFASAEASGTEIAYCTIVTSAGLAFVNEYNTRQSPMVLLGPINPVGFSTAWQITEGKCEYISTNIYPTAANYPITSKTMAFIEAYKERWDTSTAASGALYDVVRFILPDAIERAGTIETEKVIEALETTDIETSLAQHFVFTESHDIMLGEVGPNKADEGYFSVLVFQWQNGELAPVYPKNIMEEAGATYTFPDWPGPWDSLN